jgi:hypothetical protein
MELLGHSPIPIVKERTVTWTFSYAYFEGKENVQVTVLSFTIGIGECPSNSIPIVKEK